MYNNCSVRPVRNAYYSRHSMQPVHLYTVHCTMYTGKSISLLYEIYINSKLIPNNFSIHLKLVLTGDRKGPPVTGNDLNEKS